MNEKEVKEFVKELGVLGFEFCSERTVYYKTLIPFIYDGETASYEISFYTEDNAEFFKYDSVNKFLSRFQIAEVSLRSDTTGLTLEEIYFSQYKG